jgi:hypothetical protein
VKPRCVLCKRPAKDQHHPTLRDAQGERLDDELKVPLCRSHHLAAHNKLRVLDLQRAYGGGSGVERVELRLRRMAVFLADMAPTYGEFFMLLAAAMTRWADELQQDGRALDRRDPSWREEAEGMR